MFKKIPCYVCGQIFPKEGYECLKCGTPIPMEPVEQEESDFETDCLLHGKIGGLNGDCPRC